MLKVFGKRSPLLRPQGKELVKIETDIPAGQPAVLVEASRDAEMMRRLRGNRALRQLDLGFDGNRAGRKGAVPGRRHALKWTNGV